VPRLPRTRAPDLSAPRRLGDPVLPPPLPRSVRAIDVEDRSIALEPPAPPVDPFDDDDDEDSDGDANDLDGTGVTSGESPVTFYLRGGRMRVPVAASAIARADRRLSRLARKRGRRL
jgi:hypothetical protein